MLIPAFSGLSAPYWRENTKAAVFGMTRTTGQREFCRAAEESTEGAARFEEAALALLESTFSRRAAK